MKKTTLLYSPVTCKEFVRDLKWFASVRESLIEVFYNRLTHTFTVTTNQCKHVYEVK